LDRTETDPGNGFTEELPWQRLKRLFKKAQNSNKAYLSSLHGDEQKAKILK
jgi:hypothetical protein